MNLTAMFVSVCGLAIGLPALSQTPALRSALFIGLSQCAPNSGAATLEGVPCDMESTKPMATAMGIPSKQIPSVRDQDATKHNIPQDIEQLSERSREGGRSFICLSGPGPRCWDPTVSGCVEGLLSHEGHVIPNAALALAIQNISAIADQGIAMIDACQQPTNLKTRRLLGEVTRLGALQENGVLITSSHHAEVSFDALGNGGLASQGVRVCLRDNLAKAMNSEHLSPLKFKVEGHPDAKGISEYMLDLPIHRAASVQAYLPSQNVSPERLQAEGKGA